MKRYRNNLRACLTISKYTGLSIEEIETEYSEKRINEIIMAINLNNGEKLSDKQQAIEAGFTEEEMTTDIKKAKRNIGY